MLLLEPQPTQFDLRWRMFGIDVRVHPMFWLIAAILGFSFVNATAEQPLLVLAVWMGCVFLSVLIHELGHVLMFRLCGSPANIVLYAFGGLAIPQRRLYLHWQRIAVSAAGPLAQLLIAPALACVVLALNVGNIQEGVHAVLSCLVSPLHAEPLQGRLPLAEHAISFLMLISLFWALFNLLPIYPLDGGHICRDFLDGVVPHGQGVRYSLIVSMAVAGVLALHCFTARDGFQLIPFVPPGLANSWNGLMLGMLAFQSFQLLQQERNPPWRR